MPSPLTWAVDAGEIAASMSQDHEKRVHARAVAMNQEHFRDKQGAALVEGSPHLKHATVRELCGDIVTEVHGRLTPRAVPIRVLDMGAGDGVLTLQFLNLGAHVVAADASDELLSDLQKRGASFRDALTIMSGDIFALLDQLAERGMKFDVIGASSFLHHIPDYLELCRRALKLLAPGGIFFTLQDPLRYDTLSRSTYFFDRISYFGWRSTQGDYVRGLKTRCRRLMGVYRDDLAADTAEYHVVRNGVDQIALKKLFEKAGLRCEIRPYWSTQSTVFQKLGDRMHVRNTFGLIAQRPP
jgi:2-polyprenyl-3-methyl-5-hydroxy-6-metoxy-1,4-benzoquinol methylase